MDNQPTNQPTNQLVKVYKVSWEVYLKQALVFLIVFIILLTLSLSFQKSTPSIFYIGLVITLIWTIWCGINVLRNLKMSVYLDENGVWISSGIFPWEKGIWGTNWRDISEASYRTGFFSWILKSYSIRIAHRYTKASEILLTNIRYGNELVEEINRIVQEKNLY